MKIVVCKRCGTPVMRAVCSQEYSYYCPEHNEDLYEIETDLAELNDSTIEKLLNACSTNRIKAYSQQVSPANWELIDMLLKAIPIDEARGILIRSIQRSIKLEDEMFNTNTTGYSHKEFLIDYFNLCVAENK